MLENIKWLGHAGFKIKGEKTIYIDPFKIKETEPAGIIIVTHEHFDHLSPDDIKKIQTTKTTIVTTKDCAEKLSGNIKTVCVDEKINIGNVQIEAVPAYNINKNFHQKEKSWIGVIVTVNGKRIYHAGDTDNIPEMSNLKNIDVALLPVSGTYVMTAEEAADAANKIMPKIAVPMHYGAIVGSIEDAEKFKSLCRCKVEIVNIHQS